MPEIIIQIKKDGSTKVSVEGVAGPSCTDLTKLIEEALGEVSSRECSVEYYETLTESQSLEQKS